MEKSDDKFAVREYRPVYCDTVLQHPVALFTYVDRSIKLITFTSLKVFQVLKYTTCFGRHGHYQVLKICLMRKSLLSLVTDAYAVCLMCVCVCVCVVVGVLCFSLLCSSLCVL
jgi:hypothetical protein